MAPYMEINLPAGGTVVVVESEVSPVTLYTNQSSAHKRCFFRHYMQVEKKMTSSHGELVGFCEM